MSEARRVSGANGAAGALSGPGGRSRALAAALAGAGLCVAAYLTLVHYAQGAVPLVCANSGVVDCDRVTSSAQSAVGPIPVAVLGVVWCAGVLALLAVERRTPESAALLAELAWAAAGLLVVLYLVYAELFLIGAICQWCTVLHVLTAALFLLAVFRWTGSSTS